MAHTKRRLSPANNTGVVSLVLEFQAFDGKYVLASLHFILRREVFQIDLDAVFAPFDPSLSPLYDITVEGNVFMAVPSGDVQHWEAVFEFRTSLEPEVWTICVIVKTRHNTKNDQKTADWQPVF